MSINMVGNQGEAKDVVDEEQTNDPEVSPTLSVPLK